MSTPKKNLTPEKAAEVSGNQIVTPPVDDRWKKFIEIAICLQETDSRLDFVICVHRFQRANKWLLGMEAWHTFVRQEADLWRLRTP